LDYKAKVLHLEPEKVIWSQGQKKVPNMVVDAPSTTKPGPSTKGLVQAMSQVILKVG